MEGRRSVGYDQCDKWRLESHLDQLSARKLAWIVLPILHSADYSLVTPESPAVDGEVVLLYATGLGPVSNTPGDGTPAPDAPLEVTKTPPQVWIDGQAASVLWSGLAPGFVGLYQINVQVPMGIHGINTVSVTLADAPSNTLSLAIK